MVKATIVCGSANMIGITNRMCEAAAGILRSAGYDVAIFYPADMNIRHCRDCGECDKGDCIIRDDMQKIYDRFVDSDLLILSTPIHFSGPSSVIKTVMDRFQPYWADSERPHPDYCLALMCGGSKNPNFEMTERMIRAFCLTIGMEFRGSLQISDTDSGVDDTDERVKGFLSGFLGNRIDSPGIISDRV